MSMAFYPWRLYAVIICMCLYCHNCYNSFSDVVVHRQSTYLEMQWLRVEILAGRALIERQCTLEENAQYVNVRGSVHVFYTSLRLTNHK